MCALEARFEATENERGDFYPGHVRVGKECDGGIISPQPHVPPEPEVENGKLTTTNA